MSHLKNMNWRRGFDRIFVLLCISWLIFVIYEPVYEGRSFAAQNYTLQLEQADESYRLDGDEIKWKKRGAMPMPHFGAYGTKLVLETR